MCGGRGTRLGGATEKALVPVAGEPMVERVLAALADSRVGRVQAAVSPHAPATRERLAGRNEVRIVETPGDGYVADLRHALGGVTTPVVTVASDLPLLAGDCVDRLLGRVEAAGSGDGDPTSLATYVPVELKRELGVSVDATATVDGRAVAPTGLNVVADGARDECVVVEDRRLAVNANRPRDLRAAAALLEGDR
jgi:adenosylcobinamide-phosphate guanylyltransferase